LSHLCEEGDGEPMTPWMDTATRPDINTDNPLANIPSWVLRCAFNGDEWLVMSDSKLSNNLHQDCGPWTSRQDYLLFTCRGFGPCALCGRAVTGKNERIIERVSGTRAKADAAFERIEADWIGGTR